MLESIMNKMGLHQSQKYQHKSILQQDLVSESACAIPG